MTAGSADREDNRHHSHSSPLLPQAHSPITPQTFLILGFEPYDERMYPHTFDVVTHLKRHHKVVVSSADDRGLGLYRASTPSPIAHRLRYCVKNLIDGVARNVAMRALAIQRFDVVIAIDHTALNEAVRWFPASRLIFWSHDIIARDHPWRASSSIATVLQKNRQAVKQCHCVWVQDENRARLLDDTIGSETTPKVILPVSLSDDDHARAESLRRASTTDRRRVPHLLHITPSLARGTGDLLRGLSQLQVSFFLTVQGNVPAEVTSMATKYGVPLHAHAIYQQLRDLRALLAQSDVGLVTYEGHDQNNYHVTYASGQLVEFLRLGIPVIACGHNDLARYRNADGGLVHTDYDTLTQAITHIMRNYAAHSRAARSLFETHYNLGKLIQGAEANAIDGLA